MTKAEELFENMFKKRLFLSTKHKDWCFRNTNQFSKDEHKKDIVAFIQAKLFSNIEETKDHLADPDCYMCEGRGFYKALCVGEYDEQEITVQCACNRKQNLSRFDV